MRAPGSAELVLPRQRMAERLAASGVNQSRVIEALATVPRHRLVPEVLHGDA